MDFEEAKKRSKNVDARELLEKLQPTQKIHVRGGELRTVCPVHEGAEGAENFSVNNSTHQWICHSRGCKGTNLIELLAQAKKIDFSQAAREFCDTFGIRTESNPIDPNNKYNQEDILKCWNDAKPQGQDTYFSKKKLPPPPIARFGKNPKGYYSTIVPLKDIEGELKAILCVSKEGKYVYGSTKGAFAQIGEINPNRSFYVGEGIATLQTAWESTKKEIPAISCGTWSNIEPVISAIKLKYPNSNPILLIDADEGGNGEKAARIVKSKFPETQLRKPSFESFKCECKEKPADFNDIISKCGQSLEEVKRQLSIEYHLPGEPKEPAHSETQEDLFYKKLGQCIGDLNFALQLKERTYDTFEAQHRKLFSSGSLITGYEKIDDQLYIAKGDFIVIQAMSNHGKTSLMLQLAHSFLQKEENKSKNPMCIYITYESSPLQIDEKWINLISHECNQRTAIQYSREHEERFIYPEKNEHLKTIETVTSLYKEKINILKRVPLERIGTLIDIYKSQYPNKTIILFLDYIQAIDTKSNVEGWQKIKEIAYTLEAIAIEKEIIIFTGSQVNERRQVREGRDIYNAATTVIDILNHSHTQLKSNDELIKLYKEPVNGSNVCTISAFKQKHGNSFELRDYFLFNGYNFKENTDKKDCINSKNKQIPTHDNY